MAEAALNLKKLKEKAHELKPIMQIGKEGLSEKQIEELKKRTKKRSLVKVKVLKSVKEMKEEFAEKIEKEGFKVIEIKGNVMTVYKERE